MEKWLNREKKAAAWCAGWAEASKKTARAQQRRGDRTEQNKKILACTPLLLTGQHKGVCMQSQKNKKSARAAGESDQTLHAKKRFCMHTRPDSTQKNFFFWRAQVLLSCWAAASKKSARQGRDRTRRVCMQKKTARAAGEVTAQGKVKKPLQAQPKKNISARAWSDRTGALTDAAVCRAAAKKKNTV
jgi:hypothetical protein